MCDNNSFTKCRHVPVQQLHLQADGLPRGTVGVVNTAGQNVLDPLRRWGDKLKADLYGSRYTLSSVRQYNTYFGHY